MSIATPIVGAESTGGKTKQKRKGLCRVHTAWIADKLRNEPEKWRISDLGSAFERAFPSYGKDYLTQNHIDKQRKHLHDKKQQQETQEECAEVVSSKKTTDV